MNNEDKSRRLFRWAIGYLFHHNENQKERIVFGFSRVVNFAFACELLLKSHLMRQGNIRNGHWLKDLFNELNQDKKDYIKDRMSTIYVDGIYRGEQFDFESILEEQTKVFVEWRYPYDKDFNASLENRRGHYGFLYHLAKVLINKYKIDYKEFPTYNEMNPSFEAFLPNEHFKLD